MEIIQNGSHYPPASFQEAARTSDSETIVFNVKKPIKNVFGRTKFLRLLHQTLDAQNLTILSDSGVSIASQMGTMGTSFGKTETVRMYVENYGKFFYKNVVWLDAQSDDSLESDFVQIFEKCLKNPTKHENDPPKKSVTNLVHQVYEILDQNEEDSKSKTGTLIIFDNVPEDCENIQKFLPPPPSLKNCFTTLLILDNSKNADVCLQNFFQNSKILHLDPLTVDECTDYLLEMLKLPKNEKNIKDAIYLSNSVGRLPLVVQLAVAYIEEKNRDRKIIKKLSKGYTMKHYMKDFRMMRNFIQQKPTEILKTDNRIDLIFKTSLSLTLDRLNLVKNENGKIITKIIHTLAFLHGDQIGMNVLEALFSKIDQKDFKKYLNLLERHSILNKHEENQNTIISICRISQQVIFENISEQDKMDEMVALLLTKFSTILTHLFNRHGTEEFLAGIVTNIFAFLKKIENLPLSQSLSKNVISFKLNFASKLKTIENFHHVLPHLHRLYEEIRKSYDLTYGPSNEMSMRILLQIARLYQNQKEWDQALSSYKEIWEICEKNKKNIQKNVDGAGEDEKFCLGIMMNIARILTEQENFEGALNWYDKILRFSKNSRSHQHLQQHHLSILNKMADLNEKHGFLDKAMNFYERAFKKSKLIFGKDHPSTLEAQFRQANLMRKKGLMVQSMVLHEGILLKRRKILGEHHKDTHSSMHCIAGLFEEQGHFDVASGLFEKVFQKRSQLLGLDHPDTMETMWGRGICRSQQNLRRVQSLDWNLDGGDERRNSFSARETKNFVKFHKTCS